MRTEADRGGLQGFGREAQAAGASKPTVWRYRESLMGEDVDGRWLSRLASPALEVHRVPVVRRRFCNQQFIAPGFPESKRLNEGTRILQKGSLNLGKIRPHPILISLRNRFDRVPKQPTQFRWLSEVFNRFVLSRIKELEVCIKMGFGTGFQCGRFDGAAAERDYVSSSSVCRFAAV